MAPGRGPGRRLWASGSVDQSLRCAPRHAVVRYDRDEKSAITGQSGAEASQRCHALGPANAVGLVVSVRARHLWVARGALTETCRRWRVLALTGFAATKP